MEEISNNEGVGEAIAQESEPLYSKKTMKLFGFILLAIIAVIVFAFSKYVGGASVKACATLRRTIQIDYFAAEDGYGITDFDTFLSKHYPGKWGSCRSARDVNYFWDDTRQCVACINHDNSIYPIKLFPEDGAMMTMLYDSFVAYNKLHPDLPDRNEDGALIWSDVISEDEKKANYWLGYFDWINYKDFEPRKINSLRVFFAKDASGGYSNDMIGIYLRVGGGQRIIYSDYSLASTDYKQLIEDGQLTKKSK